MADDADAFHGAEVLEIGDRDGIGGAAFEPLGGVDLVADLATADEGAEAVFPEAVIDEADGERAADAKGLEDDGGGIVEFLDGARADDAIEMAIRKLAHERRHVALIGGEAARDTGGDTMKIEVHADGADLFRLDEVVEERAFAAAEIEHA